MKKIDLFVPGRLCLFGEHSDWAGKYRTMNASLLPGEAIVTGIGQGIYATVEPAEDFIVTSEAPELADVWQDFSCPMDMQELKRIAHSSSFFSYCAGVASYMNEWYRVKGVHINITRMTLPIRSGLSSSAAICVLTARAFNLLYDLNLNTMGEMNIAYWGELRTDSRCGRLDQACAFGVHPVHMIFDAEEVEVENFNIKSPLYWVFSEVGGQKDTIRILADLNRAYPFASNDSELKLQEQLGVINHEIVHHAMKYMREGRVEELGALMTESMQLFDQNVRPMSPEQLEAPKLHALLRDPEIQTLIYGGKGVGSHGDGSVQFLARSQETQQRLVDLLRGRGLEAYALTIQPKHTIRKAIIPVAGFGTRLYPVTRGVRKEFIPVVDQDGMVKPIILVLLEQLLNSGIEEICIILGDEEERQHYHHFFETPLSDEHLAKLSQESRRYEEMILDIGKHLTYVYQTEKLGFGHAVYQARQFAGSDPVLLLLGDTIYRSDTNKPCSLQLIEAYEQHPSPMIAIDEIPLSQVGYFGVIHGEWSATERDIMQMHGITEKPTSAYAEQHLGVREQDGQPHFYGVFGQYVLTPSIFEQLEHNIANGVTNSKGEYELTTALEQVRQQGGMTAVRLHGKAYDLGNPQAFRQTVAEF